MPSEDNDQTGLMPRSEPLQGPQLYLLVLTHTGSFVHRYSKERQISINYRHQISGCPSITIYQVALHLIQPQVSNVKITKYVF